MMLGASERSWFTSDLTVLFFFLFSFLVQIVLLSMLIEVVSDSHDFAMVRAKQLFERARYEQAAELVMLGAVEWKGPLLSTCAAAIKLGATAVATVTTTVFSADKNSSTGSGGDGGGDDPDSVWQGRALDTERRTRRAVEESSAALAEILEQQNREHSDAMDEVRATMKAMSKRFDAQLNAVLDAKMASNSDDLLVRIASVLKTRTPQPSRRESRALLTQQEGAWQNIEIQYEHRRRRSSTTGGAAAEAEN